MFKAIVISLAIALCIGIAGFACFLAGTYNAPQQEQRDQMDYVQALCDATRQEPWKDDIKTSCAYMQEFFAVDYKCEEIRGCFTVRRSDGEVRY